MDGNSNAVSAPGDSGALICDIDVVAEEKDFGDRALVLITIVLGAEENYGVWNTVGYATPINIVLKDIENFMNWDSGSIKFCEEPEEE